MAGRPYQASSRGIVIGMEQLERLKRGAAAMANAPHAHQLADHIGQVMEDNARKRIRETKRAPSGKRWKPWSDSYKQTRGPQHSLLVGEGDLADSITHVVHGPLEVEVGSNLDYAAAHLFGLPDQGLPARPFLDTDGGFADASEREEIRDVLREAFQLRLL